MDVKSAFLNNDLKEEVYVHQPLGFAIPGKEGKTAYAKRIVELAGLTDYNPALTPMEKRLKLSRDSTTEEVDTMQYWRLVGSLCYLAHTRPDLAVSVGYISRFMQRSTTEHQQAVKRIICYIVGTLDHGLYYPRCLAAAHFIGYSHSDHADDINTSKSTSGILFLLGKCLVNW
ncbi:secreted RxLR effector protein 161-like [Miscanthus floridulus]|uniref:secreted RxLR effector protein 161-like n=1 Tax=Miscanthus floridulus TaxID=154761 RepID=UPI00345B156C